MNLRLNTRRRFLGFVFVIGVVVGAVTAVGQDLRAGLISFAIVMGSWLIILFVPWSGLELLQAQEPDERQGALGLEAMAASGVVMVLVAMGGAMVEVAQGRQGPFVAMAAVGGASFFAASIIMPRVRRQG